MHVFRLLLLLTLLLPAIAGASGLQPGDRAPDFSGINLQDGKTLKLSKLRGKVVYVDFWASWCPPCRVSLPLLNTLHEDLAKQGFTVIGVNVDQDAEAAQRVMNRAGLTYPVVRDAGEETYLAYGIDDMPSAYLLDRQGHLHSVHRGFRASEFPALRAEIEQLLKVRK